MKTGCDELYTKFKWGRRLDRLGLPEIDGRILIEGMTVPKPIATSSFQHEGKTHSLTKNDQHLSRKRWRNLHFRKCDLRDLAFFNCSFSNCVFERCDCRHQGFWNSAVEQCNFFRSKLSSVAFGGTGLRPGSGSKNRFIDLVFDGCDFRYGAHSNELFSRCRFANCRFDAVNFNGAVFEDCQFEGKVYNTMFQACYSGLRRQGTQNSMARCNFTGADVSLCAFVGIDLNPDMFAKDNDVIILPKGPADWLEWGRRIDADNHQHKGTRWWIDLKAEQSGAPTMTTRRDLAQFSDKEVDELIRITKAP